MSGMNWFYEFIDLLGKYNVRIHDIEHLHGFHL